ALERPSLHRACRFRLTHGFRRATPRGIGEERAPALTVPERAVLVPPEVRATPGVYVPSSGDPGDRRSVKQTNGAIGSHPHDRSTVFAVQHEGVESLGPRTSAS